MPINGATLCQMLMFAMLVCGAGWTEQNFTITADSVGKIRIGITLAELRKTAPEFRFRPTSDGDGVVLTEIAKGRDICCYVYAGDARLDKIDFIEVIDPRYRTIGGLHPGMLVAQSEKILGKLQKIAMSEIESREFATFQKSPEELGIRLYGIEGTAGDYAKNSRETRRYRTGAYIYSLLITGH